MNCTRCSKRIDDEAAYCPYCGQKTLDAPSYDDYTYDGFISYRHLPLDSKIARKLHRALERYVIPRTLQREGMPRKLGRIFRDEDELPTSSSLPDQLREALKKSRCLIVVCSEQTNESLWVSREIELFASFHGRHRIIIALAHGEPSESFPTLLRSRTQIDHEGKLVEVEDESLAADFRDGKRSTFRIEMLRIVASMIGCGFDDLRQRHRTRQQRLVAGISLAVSSASLLFGSYAYHQQLQIASSYQQIQRDESEFLATESAELLAKGDRDQAISVALAALPSSSQSQDRPFVPAAQMALENALGVNLSGRTWAPLRSVYCAGEGCFGDKTGLIACWDDNNSIAVIDANGELVSRIELSSDAEQYGRPWTGFAGNNLLVSSRGIVKCFDPRSGKERWSTQFDENAAMDSCHATSPSEETLAIITNRQLCLIDVSNGHMDVVEFEDKFLPGFNDIVVIDDTGERAAIVSDGILYCVDLRDKSVRETTLKLPEPRAVSFVDKQMVVITEDNDELSSGSVSVEAFDHALNPLWSFDDTRPFSTTSDGTPDSYTIKICGIYQHDKDSKPQIAALLGTSLVLFDKATGSLTYRTTCESTFLDATIEPREDDGDRILVVTQDGTVGFRRPTDDSDNQSGYESAFDTVVGEATYARFLKDGENGVTLVMRSNSPSKLRLYRLGYGDYIASAYPSKPYVHYDKKLYRTADGKIKIAFANDMLSIMDNETLEPILDIPVSMFSDSFSWDNFFTTETSDMELYVSGYEKAGKGQGSCTAIYAINLSDASIEKHFTITEEGTHVWPGSLPSGKPCLIATGLCDIRILSADDGSEVARFDRSDQKATICGAGNYGNALVIFSQQHVRGVDTIALRGINIETGDPIDIKPAAYEAFGNDMRCVGSSSSTLVLGCSDNVVRAFNMERDELMWESSRITTGIHCVFVDEASGNVLVQDGRGYCMLLAGDSGLVLSVSSTPVSPFSTCYMLDDGRTAICYGSTGFLNPHWHLVMVTMDADEFGPISEVPNGVFVNSDGTKIALLDRTRGVGIAQRYTLDELIEKGRTWQEKHPLTEAERTLYRVP